MATDQRHKNANWTVGSSDGRVSFDGAHLAVLMDIRDELQAMNRRLSCVDTLAIPALLRQIKANTGYRKKRAAAAVKAHALKRVRRELTS